MGTACHYRGPVARLQGIIKLKLAVATIAYTDTTAFVATYEGLKPSYPTTRRVTTRFVATYEGLKQSLPSITTNCESCS